MEDKRQASGSGTGGRGARKRYGAGEDACGGRAGERRGTVQQSRWKRPWSDYGYLLVTLAVVVLIFRVLAAGLRAQRHPWRPPFPPSNRCCRLAAALSVSAIRAAAGQHRHVLGRGDGPRAGEAGGGTARRQRCPLRRLRPYQRREAGRGLSAGQRYHTERKGHRRFRCRRTAFS